MSYANLVRSNVRLAFKLIKDLGQDVVFILNVKDSFDFETGLQKVTQERTVVKVFISDTKNKERKTKEKHIYTITEYLPNLRLSEAVLINNQEWKIGNVVEHNGYLTQFDVYRE